MGTWLSQECMPGCVKSVRFLKIILISHQRMPCIPSHFSLWSLSSLQTAAKQQVVLLRVQGSGAAGFGWGALGPRHSHSLGLMISNYAFGLKKSSRLKILGPLSTSVLNMLQNRKEATSEDVFPRLDLLLAWAQTALGLSPRHPRDMLLPPGSN